MVVGEKEERARPGLWYKLASERGLTRWPAARWVGLRIGRSFARLSDGCSHALHALSPSHTLCPPPSPPTTDRDHEFFV